MCLMHQDLMVKQVNYIYVKLELKCLNMFYESVNMSRWFDFLCKVNTCSITDNCQVLASCY